ncbi:ccr4 associated factor [Trichuris trichiura]|uniref:poly(A)-specific ribonuclease n=1 Tax=Trichuris trichiura TaxID=36087 RepID=A0A077Z1L3_TRITR|nr:ccr4 associated factor [Trichuris trichiura]
MSGVPGGQGQSQSHLRQAVTGAVSVPVQRRCQAPSSSVGRSYEDMGIRDVWKSNLRDEIDCMSYVVENYPVIAMDTEFPGIVARPIGDFRSTADYQYQLMRCNVHLLKLIQVGFSFFTHDGRRPPGISTWQFNFSFNLAEDMYAHDSIQLLQKSGIDFDRLQRDGISTFKFAELLLTSGLVLMDNVLWLSFHSGYDFGYMIKILSGLMLPETESGFFETLKLYFPVVYDVKHLMNATKNLRGGLQEIADILQVERIGPQHQAGSDSLLTGATFFRMKELCFDGNIDPERYAGYLYGLSSSGQNASEVVLPGVSTSSEDGTTSRQRMKNDFAHPMNEKHGVVELDVNGEIESGQKDPSVLGTDVSLNAALSVGHGDQKNEEESTAVQEISQAADTDESSEGPKEI